MLDANMFVGLLERSVAARRPVDDAAHRANVANLIVTARIDNTLVGATLAHHFAYCAPSTIRDRKSRRRAQTGLSFIPPRA